MYTTRRHVRIMARIANLKSVFIKVSVALLLDARLAADRWKETLQ
jgi:hypothetical protein